MLVSHTLLGTPRDHRTNVPHVLTLLPQDPSFLLHREQTQGQFVVLHSTVLGSSHTFTARHIGTSQKTI